MLNTLKQTLNDLTELGAHSKTALGGDEFVDCMLTLHHLEQVIETLQIQFVQSAEAMDLPSARRFRKIGSWVQKTLLLDPRQIKELMEYVEVVGPTEQQLVLDGRASVRQVAAIADTVQAIPPALAELEDVSLAEAGPIGREAEKFLLERADRLSAFQLRKVGAGILEQVAPHLAERAAEAARKRKERNARPRRGFTVSPQADGLSRLFGYLGTEDAEIVRAALGPLCRPRPGDTRTAPQIRADALVEVCRFGLRTGVLPAGGGEKPQVPANVNLDASGWAATADPVSSPHPTSTRRNHPGAASSTPGFIPAPPSRHPEPGPAATAAHRHRGYGGIGMSRQDRRAVRKQRRAAMSRLGSSKPARQR